MRKLNIGFVVFPEMLQLDLTGAYAVFAAGPETKVHLVSTDGAPVRSSDGLLITPTTTMRECPQLQILCVPGGSGVLPLLEDDTTLAFVRKQAENADYITSVCTGALVLGAAGLLRGRAATTHWSSVELLAPFGATYTPRRVVVDGNLITAAGVTSGIDMALTLAVTIWGENVAKTMALNMEYAPEPPFASGSPQDAPADVLQGLLHKNAQRQQARVQAVSRAARNQYITNTQ